MPECSVSKVMGRARHNRRRGRTTLRFSSDGDPLISYECKLDNEDFKNCKFITWYGTYVCSYTIYCRQVNNAAI